MNNAIRHTWVVSVALFVSLFAALSLIQVVFSDDLDSDPRNSRQIIADAGAPRGPITVDGTPIAESVPSDHSQYDYQRVYNEPELYSHLTGYFSVTAGPSPAGIESALNDEISGHSDSQFFDRITALFTGETVMGARWNSLWILSCSGSPMIRFPMISAEPSLSRTSAMGRSRP